MDSTGPAIGVFDSGVGGLTIFEAVRDRLPHGCYYYLSDNGNFPYGIKSEAQVIACTLAAAQRFVARFHLDLLIIACNTASTVALERVRTALPIPVIGVVPAIKPAVAMSRTRTIGLLATPGTVSRSYTDALIQDFAKAARVIKCGSGLLVKLAESKLRGESLDREQIRQEIAPLFAASPQEEFKRLDTVVLGCTHFPLIQDELTAAAPWPVQWVDSSQAIAARAVYLMTEKALDQGSPLSVPLEGQQKIPQGGAVSFCVTRMDDDAKRLLPITKSYGFQRFEIL